MPNYKSLDFNLHLSSKKSSDRKEINVTNFYRKSMRTGIYVIKKNWVMIMDECQDIENIEGFCDYLTNTWINDDALFDFVL